jgi:hypothetical protein
MSESSELADVAGVGVVTDDGVLDPAPAAGRVAAAAAVPPTRTTAAATAVAMRAFFMMVPLDAAPQHGRR